MNQKNKRKNKYNNISLAKKAAYKAMSDYIRERDKYTCFTCGVHGDKTNIDDGHFIPRGYSYWSFDERNNHAQCSRENCWLQGNWPVYFEKMCELYGKDFVEDMISKKNIVVKRSIKDYNEIEEYYQEKLKDLSDE